MSVLSNNVRVALEVALRRRVREARRDFHSFMEFVVRDRTGETIEQAVIHRTWMLHARYCWQNGIHPAILAPFGHGKTTQLVVGLTAFELGQDPTIRVKIVCNVDDTAKDRVAAISTVLSKNRRYKAVFPWVRPGSRTDRTVDKYAQQKILLDRPGDVVDPSVAAYGVFTSGTGGRGDLLLFDDVCDQNNSVLKAALREDVVHEFDTVWMSRREAGEEEAEGRVLYLGTPWHTDDLTHRLMKRGSWCVLVQKVSADCDKIEQEVYNPPPGYPLPRLQEAARRFAVVNA